MHKWINSSMIMATILLGGVTLLSACEDEATIASRNLSKDADNFGIMRRVVFMNGFTNTPMLSVEGKCSIDDQGNQLEVTCKTGPKDFEKHFFGKGDNTPYFVEQMAPVNVSVYHNKVTFMPQSILPDIDFRGDADALIENHDATGN